MIAASSSTIRVLEPNKLGAATQSAGSVLLQYSVSDFVGWDEERLLTLNPVFQRRPVWTSDGQTYLIDTMLRGFPIPKVFLRSVMDTKSKKAVRDVVDGQQRIRAILAFANDELRLNKRAEEYAGLRYSDLAEEDQQRFLSYQIGVEQLINGNDEFVLEVFSRINSYTVPLNGAEIRNARYQTEFKWFIKELADQLRPFFLKHGILSTRDIFRMGDDDICAELVGVVCRGVSDGGSAAIETLYKTYRDDFSDGPRVLEAVRVTIRWLEENIGELLSSPVISRSPQFLLLFAATCHQLVGIPQGKISEMPPRGNIASPRKIRDRLAAITEAVENKDDAGPYREFVSASSKATTRMNSRSVRFLEFSNALIAR